jgi:pimeloyl-ACP methyl ester carboxylesterase
MKRNLHRSNENNGTAAAGRCINTCLEIIFKNTTSWRFLMVGLCFVSTASSLSSQALWSKHIITRSAAAGGHPVNCRRPTWLHQSSTALQETTVSLQWTEFYNPGADTSETPVLLLHGLLGSKRNFASLASSLGNQLETQRRIIGVDLRNHGDSGHAIEMSYSAMTQDVVEFMDSQGLDKIILVGHSMGGKVAQAMSLLHPHRVDGLVVLDIAPVQYTSLDPHWKAVEDIMHSMRSVEDVSSKSVLDKQLRSSIPDPNLRAFVLTNYDSRKKGWKIPVATICEQLDCIAGFDLTDHHSSTSTSRSYEGDVFIIHGGQSRFVRHAYMDRIAELFPNHMLTTIRGAGHWVHAEAPDDTIALLKQYLDR